MNSNQREQILRAIDSAKLRALDPEVKTPLEGIFDDLYGDVRDLISDPDLVYFENPIYA